MNAFLNSKRTVGKAPRRFAHASWTSWTAVVLLVVSGPIGCGGGGSTGLEDLDSAVPPPPVIDAGGSIDVGSTPDTSVIDGVVDVAVDVSNDVSVRVDSPSIDPEEDSGPRGDGARVRDGVVARDGIILDPTDSSTAGDVARDVGPVAVCGDGKKEEKEQCDDGNTVSGDGCSGICTDQKVCDACLAANCADGFGDPTLWPLCGGLAGTAKNGEGAGRLRKDLCQEVYACALRTNCMTWDSSDVTPCYCGTAVEAACLQAGKANGPCKAEIENGVESVDPKIIADSFTQGINASGAALLIRRCAHDLCADECSPYVVRDGGTPDAITTSDGSAQDSSTTADGSNAQDVTGAQ